MNYARVFVRGTGIVFVSLFIAGFLGTLLKLVLARNLTTNEFGAFYSILTVVTMLYSLRSLGMDSTTPAFISRFRAKKDNRKVKEVIVFFLSSLLFFSSLILLLTILFSGLIASHYLKNPGLSGMLRLMAFMFFLSVVTDSFLFIFQGFSNMKFYAVTSVISPLLSLGFASVLLSLNKSVNIVILSFILTYIVSFFINSYLFFRLYPDFRKVKFKKDMGLYKEMIKFSIPLALFALINGLIDNAGILILTYFTSFEVVGFFTIAFTIVHTVVRFAKAISIILLPISSELHAIKHPMFSKGISVLYKYFLAMTLPIAVVVFSYPNIIINLLFGAKYLPAVPTLRILSIAAVLISFGKMSSPILTGIGKPRVNTIISIIGVITIFTLGIPLTLIFGLTGMAAAVTITYFILFIISSYIIGSSIKGSVRLSEILRVVLASAAFIISISVIKAVLSLNVWLELVLTLGVSALVYAASLFALRLITFEEIINLAKKII